ncbi:hypothetical protein OC845_003952 [Tilletia horrida]|nr:hypothetical protein OC845_003952 [Tilletia horrida]
MEEEADHHQDLEQGTAQAQEVDEQVDDEDDDEDGDDDDDDEDDEEEEDGDNEDVDEDDEENDNDDDDDDDDDDDEGDNDGSDEDSGEDDNMSVISDGLDSSNIIATRPKRAAAAKVSDYTSEEAIRKAGVAPQDEEAAAADGEDADQTYMDADDDDDDDAAGAEGSADATDPDSKPPPKKKQRLPSPSPEPLPKPPPPRPTVRIKMITTQGAGNPSANIPQATPISMDSEEIDPDLYIMEIPHIMLEHLRQQQHPWADWVDETQRDAQKAILAQQEKEAAEKEAERERKAQAAALKAANAANAAAAAAAAAGGGESEGGGGGAAPPSGGVPDDLPPELAALLARHQEPTVPIKRVVRNRYDVTDPFVDDSELKIDEPTPVVETREKGFYVCIGPVEGFQAAQAKKKTATRRRTAANAATGANANRIRGSAAAAGGSKAGAAAIASPLKAAAQQSQPAEPPGAGQKMQQAMVATTASNQKPAGAKGAIDMLLAMRAKQTGLTVNEHVASGVVKPGTAPPPPPPPPPLPAIGHADGAGTDADPDIVEIRPSEMNGQSSARERDDRRKSEGSRTQPIAVDSTDDEDEEASAAAAKKASSSSGAAAAAGANGTPASAAAAAANVNSSGVSTRRSRSPAKAAAGADAADTSAAGAGGLGLRRTLRRNASTTAGLNSPAPGGDKGGAAAAASTQAENGKAPSSRPTPDSSAPADISISISGAAPGDSSVLSTNGTPHAGSSTPRASTSAVAAAGANGNATSTTPSGTAAAANAPRKNRYPCNPVDPRLAAAFEELRDVVSKEPFEVRTKFPAYLKPPLLKTAKLALELGEYDENFFNWLPTIFPYNRYTMMKLTKREFYEQHHAYYQTLQDETLDALKAIIDKTFPTLKAEYEEALKQWEETEGATAANTNASGTNTPALLNKGVTSGAPSSPLTPPNGASKEAGGGPAAAQAAAPAAAAAKAAPKKRWKWDDEQRAYLHTCITTENAMVELAGEKADLESGTRPFSELARRKILYKRICDLWPEPGWMDTGTISKECEEKKGDGASSSSSSRISVPEPVLLNRLYASSRPKLLADTRTKAKYEKQAARAAEEVEE